MIGFTQRSSLSRSVAPNWVRCVKQAMLFPMIFAATILHRISYREYGDYSNEMLEETSRTVSVAGRMILKRVMGKASFATIQDMSGRIQLYIAIDVAGAETQAAFKHYDLGDILGAQGTLFRTRTGELSVRVTNLRLPHQIAAPTAGKISWPS